MKIFTRLFKRLPFNKFPKNFEFNLHGPFEDSDMAFIALLVGFFVGVPVPFALAANAVISMSMMFGLMAVGVIAAPILWQAGFLVGRKLHRSCITPVGEFFFRRFEDVERDLRKAEARLDEVGLAPGSPPALLVASAWEALAEARVTAGALYPEMILHSPRLSSYWKGGYSSSSCGLVAADGSDGILATCMKDPSFPPELRLEVESFIHSLDVFGSFNASFAQSVELALKPKIRVPSAAGFVSASDSLKAKFADAALASEMDSVARADLEAFISSRFVSDPGSVAASLEVPQLKANPKPKVTFLKSRNV